MSVLFVHHIKKYALLNNRRSWTNLVVKCSGSLSCGCNAHLKCFCTVNRNSRQRRFSGKTAKVDWKQSIGKVLTGYKQPQTPTGVVHSAVPTAESVAQYIEKHPLHIFGMGLAMLQYTVCSRQVFCANNLNHTDSCGLLLHMAYVNNFHTYCLACSSMSHFNM